MDDLDLVLRLTDQVSPGMEKTTQNVDKALAQLERSVKPGSRAMRDLDDAVDKTEKTSTKLNTAFKQFDGVLASAGVNIGPHIRGLSDIADAGGKTAKELGLVSTAGLAIGAGMAAWGLTRAVMEFFELDKAVEKSWTNLLGWGDAAKEAAGANADAIALAFERTGVHARTGAEALALNTKWLKEHNAEIARANMEPFTVQLANAEMAATKLTAAQRAEIAAGLEAGHTQAEIAKQLNITEATLKVYTARVEGAAKAEKERAEQQKQLLKELAEIEHDKNALSLKWIDDLGVVERAASQKRFESAVQGIDQIETAESALRDFLMKSSLDESSYQIVKIYETADAAVAAFKGTAEQREAYTKKVMALADLEASYVEYKIDEQTQHLSALDRNIARIMAGFDPAHPSSALEDLDPAAASRPAGFGTSRYDAQGRDTWGVGGGGGFGIMGGAILSGKWSPTPSAPFFHYDKGGPVHRDGPIYAHAGEYVVPKGGELVGGGGGVNIGAIYVTHPLGTPTEIARAVKQGLADDARGRGDRRPA